MAQELIGKTALITGGGTASIGRQVTKPRALRERGVGSDALQVRPQRAAPVAGDSYSGSVQVRDGLGTPASQPTIVKLPVRSTGGGWLTRAHAPVLAKTCMTGWDSCVRRHPSAAFRMRKDLESWLVTRYSEAASVLGDQRFSKEPRHAEEALRQAGMVDLNYPAGVGLEPNMLRQDPPDHTRLRGLVSSGSRRGASGPCAPASRRSRTRCLKRWVAPRRLT
jgi:hypothetical protein